MKRFICIFLFCFSTLYTYGSALRYLPVQSGGRVKPFDTFARESVEFISGRSTFKGQSSIHVVATWILLPQEWDEISFIKIQNQAVKKVLELDTKLTHFSPQKLLGHPILIQEVSELQILKDRNEKLDKYFKEIEKLNSRLLLYQSIKRGFIPLWPPQDAVKDWLPAHQLPQQRQKELIAIFSQYVKNITSQENQDLKGMVDSFGNEQVSKAKIQAEVHYNSLNPFRWSWVLYLLALCAWGGLMLWKKYQSKSFLILLISAFILNTYGMILRSFIMSRPPVSNMFETLLWVPWAGLVLAFILFQFRKNWFPLIVGAVGGFACLFVADQASGILNGRLEPLEAVLRSNFWLSTHVLVITMSYSAFLLAFIIGDFLVIQSLLGRSIKKFKDHFWFLQKCLQVGVLLLAFGTILGAIWADYSWGRFWGWDPKEVWALVSLLGYLALLHARLQGWVKEFGLAMGSVFCFFLIIMAWYGVNFVLGKGLHSYGFGQGGLSYVLAFIAIHIVLMLLAWRRGKRLKATS